MTPTNITGAQLTVATVTGVTGGQGVNTRRYPQYNRATRLTQTPQRPRDHAAGGSCLPYTRRQMRHVIDTQYVHVRASMNSEMMALKAMLLPRFSREMSITKMKMMKIALMGTSVLEST